MSLPAVELRRRIGYVIQQVGLFPHLTVGDNVAVVPRLLGWTPARIARAGRRAARPRRPRAGGLPRPVPDRAVRRRAPARRRGARPGRGPAGDAHGRAVRRGRPDPSRAAPERVPAPPGAGPQDDHLRHPRRRRGDQDGRPHRDPPARRNPGPVRHAGRAILANPASEFVERFVGADRGPEAPLAGAGRATSSCSSR